MATYKRVFSLRLKDELFYKIEVLAENEHRSVNNLIEYILFEYLHIYEKENGVININEE